MDSFYLSKDLTDSQEEIPNCLITIQNKLDSLATIVFQNRRELDLLTAEKGGLCLFVTYCIGTWNVRSMNQGKSDVVKQEMARVNVDILRISEIKWTGMGEFNS